MDLQLREFQKRVDNHVYFGLFGLGEADLREQLGVTVHDNEASDELLDRFSELAIEAWNEVWHQMAAWLKAQPPGAIEQHDILFVAELTATSVGNLFRRTATSYEVDFLTGESLWKQTRMDL